MQRQAKMPPPKVYEQEYRYWPWGKLIKLAASWMHDNAPRNGHVLDYMCGTGFLLNEIRQLRSDLTVAGCSLAPAYIDYAKHAYPQLDVIFEDALTYKPTHAPDVIICTAGLHHLDRKLQPKLIEKVASELASGGRFLLGEELIRSYVSEQERRLAALEMGAALTAYVVSAGAPKVVVEAACDVLGNDVQERGEYKTSRDRLMKMLENHFVVESEYHIWPEDAKPFGDFLFICRKGARGPS
jgi:SAM-dependent methyltransferase